MKGENIETQKRTNDSRIIHWDDDDRSLDDGK